MAARAEPLLQHIRRLASRTNPAPDAALLTRFLETHDEAAFTALVERHGPMVLGVCRRILGDDSDAEDAFQATFLTLARKAAAIHPADSLPAWLYGVARHLALKARRSRDRRLRREAAGAQTSGARPQQGLLDQLTGREVLEIVDEELQRLPEVYRLPLILCYLEGHGHDEAARRLGWSLGSFRGRLERGRTRLQARLVRRGLALGAILLLWSLLRRGATAAIPPALMQATVQSAVQLAAGGAGGVVSQIAVLAERVSKALFAPKGKTLMLLLGVVAAAAVGGAVARQDRPATAGESQPTAETPAAPRTAEQSALRTDRYGDPLPHGALTRLGTVRWRHATGMFRMAFSRDGKGVVTAGMMSPARLWDVATGRVLHSFDDWDERSLAIVFSPDTRLAAGKVGSTGELGIWDTATGKLLRRRKERPAWANWPLAFSPDGKCLAAFDRSKGTLRLWEVATDKQRWGVQLAEIVEHGPRRVQQLVPGAEQLPQGLHFSADGKSLIWDSWQGGVHMCDAATGKEVRRWYDDKKYTVGPVAAAPNGRLFALLSRPAEGPGPGPAERIARLWDAATGKVVWQVEAEGEQWSDTAAAFSPDGKILAIGHLHGPIHLWDAATGKELRRCEGCPGAILCLAFSPDGKTLASGGGGVIGGENQMVRFWDVATGREIHRRDDGHRAAVTFVAFTPDGKTVASSGGDGAIRLWDAATGEQQRHVAAAGEHFVTARLCSITTALSADGKTIASATWQRNSEERKAFTEFRLWDRSSGRGLHRWSQDDCTPRSVAFAPDGKTVACVRNVTGPQKEAHQQVHLWEAETGKELAMFPRSSCAAFSTDGKLLAITPEPRWSPRNNSDRSPFFTLWDAATAKEICSVPPLPEGYWVQRLLFSPDGRMLATASNYNKNPNQEPSVIHLWPLFRDDPASGGVRVGTPRLLTAKGPLMLNFVLYPKSGTWAFSPDGRTLALSGEGGTVQLLEIASGKERARFSGHGGNALSLAFAPEGRRLASGSCDTTVLVWDVTGRLHNGHLRGMLPSAKQLQKFWADLAADDAPRAGRAIWALAADPARSVPFLAEQMRTATAEIKSRLAGVPHLIRDLDDDAFLVRENAKMELARLGEVAEPAMRQALAKSPSVEMRRRLEQLLKDMEANRHTPSGESLRRLRVVETLEQIGAAEAREALKELASGAPAASALALEAQAALERLERR